MSEAAQFMEGRYDHKMDPKFRVSIPVDWRPAAGEVLRLFLTRSYDLPVVVVLTEQEYLERLRQIDEHPTANPDQKRKLKGMLHLNCRPASINPQGKLLVPQNLSEKAELPADDQVVLAGRGRYFEIWSAGNFTQMELKAEATLAELNQDLGVF